MENKQGRWGRWKNVWFLCQGLVQVAVIRDLPEGNQNSKGLLVFVVYLPPLTVSKLKITVFSHVPKPSLRVYVVFNLKSGFLTREILHLQNFHVTRMIKVWRVPFALTSLP
jgi:hypothetical protein